MYPLLYRRKGLLRFCAGVIALALGLRLLLTPGLFARAWDRLCAALGSRPVMQAVVLLQTGRLPEEKAAAQSKAPAPPSEAAGTPAEAGPPPAESGAPLSEPEAPPETAAPAASTEAPASAEAPAAPISAEAPAPFTEAEAAAIELRGNCSYRVDKAALLLADPAWPQVEDPKVLILHSHSCEAYSPTPGWEYEPSGEYRTLEASRSVLAVGEALAAELEARGIGVIHDTTVCDYPHYNSSYAIARTQIKRQLEQDPSIVLVLDLHRDALEKPVREIAELDGELLAPLMLVIGTDEGGLSHPNWRDNLSTGLKLQALMNRESPGLMKKPSLRKERFNGDLAPGALIIEVGSTENSLPEALAAMPRLADGVASLLRLAQEARE